jgi:hypothetical protein
LSDIGKSIRHPHQFGQPSSTPTTGGNHLVVKLHRRGPATVRPIDDDQ